MYKTDIGQVPEQRLPNLMTIFALRHAGGLYAVRHPLALVVEPGNLIRTTSTFLDICRLSLFPYHGAGATWVSLES